jgi:hypothetical protein
MAEEQQVPLDDDELDELDEQNIPESDDNNEDNDDDDTITPPPPCDVAYDADNDEEEECDNYDDNYDDNDDDNDDLAHEPYRLFFQQLLEAQKRI